jgi:hypothetical protein
MVFLVFCMQTRVGGGGAAKRYIGLAQRAPQRAQRPARPSLPRPRVPRKEVDEVEEECAGRRGRNRVRPRRPPGAPPATAHRPGPARLRARLYANLLASGPACGLAQSARTTLRAGHSAERWSLNHCSLYSHCRYSGRVVSAVLETYWARGSNPKEGLTSQQP